MSVAELGKAVIDQGLNVIGFDTCFGGVLENIYELKNCTDFIAACPGVTPSVGWNYTALLESSCSDPLSFANSMCSSSSAQTSVYVNQKIPGLLEAFESFSKVLAESIKIESNRNENLDKLFNLKSYSYSQYPCDMYLDIFAIADFYSKSSDSNISKAANSLKQKLDEAIFTTQGKDKGIGIHFIPLVSSHVAASKHSTDYLKNKSVSPQCSFINENIWWVPTVEGNSGSLLDKLFYSNY